MKKFIENLGFVVGAIITLAAIIVCGLCAKNLAEFFDREDS